MIQRARPKNRGVMLPNDKTDSIGENTKVASYIKIYKQLNRRDKLAFICLFQALLVSGSILYILIYLPHLIAEPFPEPVGSNLQDVLIEAQEEQNEARNKEKQLIYKGESIQTSNGHQYSLFRFEKLKQYDEFPSSITMIDDEGEYAYFSKTEVFMPYDVPSWFERKHDYCDGCFVVYGIGKQVVALRNVTIYPQLGHGKVGGEDIEEVINQNEAQEKIILEKGYFVVNSKVEFDVEESLSYDLKLYLSGFITQQSPSVAFDITRARPDMIAVVTIRYEYANFYHTTMNWYDVFLIMSLFKIKPYQLEVIWLDGHPKSKLDDAWTTLYGEPVRAGSLTNTVKYNAMIWNGFGPRSHLNIHKAEYLPFIEAFRHFVLHRFDVTDVHEINCKEIRITLIWRRDYVAHPRNPSGYIARKIANEEEVWQAVKEADKHAIVNGAQLDRLDMESQLKLISTTDILIGMHGAGLTHTLYLPQSSGVIELFPYYVSAGNSHFRSMAKWRQLRYIAWANTDKNLEKKKHTTEIPPAFIKDAVQNMKNLLCEKYNK